MIRLPPYVLEIPESDMLGAVGPLCVDMRDGRQFAKVQMKCDVGCHRLEDAPEKLADGGKAGGVNDDVGFGGVPYYQGGRVPRDVGVCRLFADVGRLDRRAGRGKDSESEEVRQDELPFPADLEFVEEGYR